MEQSRIVGWVEVWREGNEVGKNTVPGPPAERGRERCVQGGSTETKDPVTFGQPMMESRACTHLL